MKESRELPRQSKQSLEVSRLAIASFVVGIIIFIPLYNFEKAIVAAIFGLIALREIELGKKSGRGFAIFGLALSLLFLAILAASCLTRGSICPR